jgi:hypothetical protein
MMKKLLLTGIAVLFLATGTAQAASLKANQWASFCNPKNGKEGYVICGYYALGLIDGLTLWKANSSDPINLCIPQEPERRPTGQEIIDVGLAYIAKHPDSKDRPIAVVLREAFEEKWPCIGM